MVDEGHHKAPDYSFRIGRERKFFVEAKKPFVRIETDRNAAYQLRRYAWSAKLPLSIVTNFAGLAVYDTRIKPNAGDSPKTARLLFLKSDEYATRWHEIAALFSKEAILKGAFDRYADSKGHRGTAAVDDDFLRTIEAWRLDLAKAVNRSNPELDTDELSFVVQATIDRILFLRICEDKGIETYGLLKLALKTPCYGKLLTLFKDAQARYNSGLFHVFPENKTDKLFDALSAEVKISDIAISKIISSLYYPTSPYEFSVISPDILGSVYERFLGSVIVRNGRVVTVELKPDLKKSGGVYYTPSHVVREMVKGALARHLTQQKAERPSIRIGDIACGSGSFLIEAYDELLNWYLQWHLQKAKSGKALVKVPVPGKEHELRLSLAERKRILLDHIYGVDIDPQAVEVTKLSLFLKLIEDTAVLPKQLELGPMQARILPDMLENIKCGNSIVGSDVLDTIPLSVEETEHFKPFDWAGLDGFSSIMNEGGFDVIIGNPPYSYRQSTIEKFKPY